MEIVLACLAGFVRRFHILPDNAVANRAFCLAFQSPQYVSTESQQAINQTITSQNDDLNGAKP